VLASFRPRAVGRLGKPVAHSKAHVIMMRRVFREILQVCDFRLYFVYPLLANPLCLFIAEPASCEAWEQLGLPFDV
jgi:hypothetical protein